MSQETVDAFPRSNMFSVPSTAAVLDVNTAVDIASIEEDGDDDDAGDGS